MRGATAALAVLSVAVTLAACAGGAASDDVLPQAAVDVMAGQPYERAIWSIAVRDVRTGELLVDENDSRLLEPASVTKTYSVGAAWLAFGPDSRIVTPVVRDGAVRNQTLRGDLVLVAKGDVLMGGQTGADDSVVFTNWDHNDANSVPGAAIADNDPLAGLRDLARQVRASGIRRIAGDVVIDDRLFKTMDFGEVDGPVSPIVINNNLIDVVTSPTRPGRPATVTLRPEVAPWRVADDVRTVAAGGTTEISVEHSGSGLITVTGTVAMDSDPVLRVINFADPATFARTAFIQELRAAGVRVTAPPVRSNTVAGLPGQVERLPEVARLRGMTFDQVATYVLKVSYNRGAQTQVCLLAVAAGSRDCDDGLAEVGRQLQEAGIDPAGVSLVDGSGQPGNYVTAASVTELMTVFAARPDAGRWRRTLPVMGVDGSLVNVQVDNPAAGHVAAKTGTQAAGDLVNGRLRLGKALGGYITARSGRELAFAVIVNGAVFGDIDGVFAANDDLGKIAASIWERY